MSDVSGDAYNCVSTTIIISFSQVSIQVSESRTRIRFRLKARLSVIIGRERASTTVQLFVRLSLCTARARLLFITNHTHQKQKKIYWEFLFTMSVEDTVCVRVPRSVFLLRIFFVFLLLLFALLVSCRHYMPLSWFRTIIQQSVDVFLNSEKTSTLAAELELVLFVKYKLAHYCLHQPSLSLVPDLSSPLSVVSSVNIFLRKLYKIFCTQVSM